MLCIVKFIHIHLLGDNQQVRDIASVGSEKKEISRKRKASASVALAFELIYQWMRKFNQRKFDTNYIVSADIGIIFFRV